MNKITKRLFGFAFLIMMVLYQFSPALLITLRAEGEEPGSGGAGAPGNSEVVIHFNGGTSGVSINENNVTYTIGEETVTVAVSGATMDATNELATVSRDNIGLVTFALTGFNSETMLMRIHGTNDGFGADLAVSNNAASLGGLNVPDEIDLIVEARAQEQGNGNGGSGSAPVAAMEPMFDGALASDSTHLSMSPTLNGVIFNIHIAIISGSASFANDSGFVSTHIERDKLNSVVFIITGDYDPEVMRMTGFLNSSGSEKQTINVNNDGTFTLPGSLCDDTHIGFELLTPEDPGQGPANNDDILVQFDRATFVDATHITMSDGKNSYTVTLQGGGSFC